MSCILRFRLIITITLDNAAFLFYLCDIQTADFQTAMLQYIIFDFLVGGFLFRIGQIKFIHIQINFNMMLCVEFGQKNNRLIFVLTADPQINISRVAQRVKNGGHDVPTDKIISRYRKSLDNVSKMLKIADVMWVVDNSTEKAELIIYSKDNEISINSTSLWSADKINRLISGNIN